MFFYKNKKLFVENWSAVKNFRQIFEKKKVGVILNNLKLGMKIYKELYYTKLFYIIGRFICNNMYCFDNVKSYEIVIIYDIIKIYISVRGKIYKIDIYNLVVIMVILHLIMCIFKVFVKKQCLLLCYTICFASSILSIIIGLENKIFRCLFLT